MIEKTNLRAIEFSPSMSDHIYATCVYSFLCGSVVKNLPSQEDSLEKRMATLSKDLA